MKRINDFETICKKLEDKKICKKNNCIGNDYCCALFAVKQYSNNGKDRVKLMTLKALALADDFGKYISIVLSFFAVVIAGLQVIPYEFKFVNGFAAAIIIEIAVLFYLKFNYINKWREYILLAIDEIISENKK